MNAKTATISLFPFRFLGVKAVADGEIEWKGRRWKARRSLNTLRRLFSNQTKWAIQWVNRDNGSEMILGVFDKLEDDDPILPMPWEVAEAVERRQKRVDGKRRALL